MMTWMNFFFQNPNAYMMEIIVSMHDFVMMFLISIMMLVFFSLFKAFYSKSLNMEFYESHYLESVWTILPFILLVLILIPSLTSLYMLDSCNFCGSTMGVVGHQWYWSYDMKDHDCMMFDSYMLNMPSEMNNRLLDVDNRVLLASHVPARFMVTSADVIHSWTIPSLGFKMDAVPGRINQFCVTPKRSGFFFGQCSEICGANHSFMPIVLEIVSVKDMFKIL